MRPFRAACGLLTLIAIATQLAVHIRLGFDVVNFFSYFTNLSNLFAAFTLLLTLVVPQNQWWVNLLRAIAVINMTLVGLVFSVLLRNTDLGDLLPWVNWVVHYIMPVLIILDWFLWPPRIRLGPSALLISLSAPLGYLAYVLVRGRATGWYPYPFLDPALAGGGGGVAAYVAGITVAFVVVGWIMLALANWRRTYAGGL
jgi:hypothetical protein